MNSDGSPTRVVGTPPTGERIWYSHPETVTDPEIRAVLVIETVLRDLEPEQQERALRWVQERQGRS